MVARITSGATPAGALYYNKDKIDWGEGRFLAAFNTPMQVIALSRELYELWSRG